MANGTAVHLSSDNRGPSTLCKRLVEAMPHGDLAVLKAEQVDRKAVNRDDGQPVHQAADPV